MTVTIDPQDFQGTDWRIAVQSNPANDAEQAKTIPLTGPATFGELTGSSPAMTPCRDSCQQRLLSESRQPNVHRPDCQSTVPIAED